MRLISSRALMIPVVVFLISLIAVPYASADIVKVQSQQACQFFTLATSPGTSQSGVYCTGSSSAPALIA
jgi:hypothetical protein